MSAPREARLLPVPRAGVYQTRADSRYEFAVFQFTAELVPMQLFYAYAPSVVISWPVLVLKNHPVTAPSSVDGPRTLGIFRSQPDVQTWRACHLGLPSSRLLD